MKETFQICGGSVTGRMHLQPLGIRNNQDAFTWIIEEDVLVAVVGDGCGSHLHSEVGAKLGVPLIAKSALDLAVRNREAVSQKFFWRRVREDVLMHIRMNAKAMGNSISEIVNEYFLFTVMGLLITERTSVVFGIGDGICGVNGAIYHVGPFPNNTPPYLAYGITGSPAFVDKPELLEFQLHQVLDTENVDSLVIGTDGISDLIAAERQMLPGKNELVGPLSQFWTEHRYFDNRDMVRRRLSLIAHSSQTVNWKTQQIEKSAGLLKDDTTLVAARRVPRKER